MKNTILIGVLIASLSLFALPQSADAKTIIRGKVKTVVVIKPKRGIINAKIITQKPMRKTIIIKNARPHTTVITKCNHRIIKKRHIHKR